MLFPADNLMVDSGGLPVWTFSVRHSTMKEMLSSSASTFLKKCHPFSLLGDRELSMLVEKLRMELYPAGTDILKQGGRTSGSLYIVKEGGIRIYAVSSGGQERALDYRDTGESFGFLSLGEDSCLNVTVQAVTDTVCYILDSSAAEDLLDRHPDFRDCLVPSYFPKQEGTGAASIVSYGRPLGAERVLFTTPVRDLAVRELLTIRADSSITEAARLMTAHRAGALIITDESGRPAGIITSSDLRDRVLAQQKNPADPASQIMSCPIVSIEGSAYCYEALLAMISHEIHHLPVTDSGRLSGIISNHDLLVLQGVSPLLVIREIDDLSTIDRIAAVQGRVTGLISMLLSAGSGAGGILRIISTVNDRIERRILDIALQTLGPPPSPFCWIVYGSAGRKEQTFRTDQDNAIIYSDSGNEEEELSSSEYFGRLAEFTVNAFQRCGFSLCPGDFMATNPVWRQPLGIWKKNFRNWIVSPTSEAIHNAVNLFDFRGLYGEMSYSSELKQQLASSMRDRPIFLRALAELTVDYKPPLGMFGSLVFEKGGERPNHLNLKDKCLTPLINIVRLFSFESNIPETSTPERIAALKNVHPVMKNVGDDLEYAFEVISMLRIRHQLEQVSMNIAPDNFLDPGKLNSLELRNIREISRLLNQIIEDIAGKYATGTRL